MSGLLASAESCMLPRKNGTCEAASGPRVALQGGLPLLHTALSHILNTFLMSQCGRPVFPLHCDKGTHIDDWRGSTAQHAFKTQHVFPSHATFVDGQGPIVRYCSVV